MGVDKIILRALFSTLISIASLFVIMFAVLIGAFPSTMMEITYDLGMDASSIRYAERAYKWSNDEYFAAYGMEVAIGAHDYKKIETCGEQLIADEQFGDFCSTKNQAMSQSIVDEGFAAYCARKGIDFPTVTNMGYEEYVYGQVCVAKYVNGNKSNAAERAFALTFGAGGITEFAQNNAVVAVLYTALGDRDAETVDVIKGKMRQLQINGLSAGDKTYFDWVLALGD